MTVSGFTVDKHDPTKRIPCKYNDHSERAWCEAAELADAELWVEADAKLTEYYEINGGFISGSRDAELTAKIAVGLATVKCETKYFDSARQAMSFAISKDDGSSVGKFARMIYELAMGYIKLQVPAQVKDEEGQDLDYYVADYAKATTEGLVVVARQLLDLFRMAYDAGMEIALYNDNTHDEMHQLVDELLVNRKENDKARPIVEKLLKVDLEDFFKAVAEDEWKKKLSANQGLVGSRPSKRARPDEF